MQAQSPALPHTALAQVDKLNPSPSGGPDREYQIWLAAGSRCKPRCLVRPHSAHPSPPAITIAVRKRRITVYLQQSERCHDISPRLEERQVQERWQRSVTIPARNRHATFRSDCQLNATVAGRSFAVHRQSRPTNCRDASKSKARHPTCNRQQAPPFREQTYRGYGFGVKFRG